MLSTQHCLFPKPAQRMAEEEEEYELSEDEDELQSNVYGSPTSGSGCPRTLLVFCYNICNVVIARFLSQV